MFLGLPAEDGNSHGLRWGQEHVGVGQNSTTGPQILILGSIYQGSMLGTHF